MMGSKRHHYLPIWYQNGFCEDGRVWVFDRKKGQCRRQQPTGTAVIGHYYSIPTTEGKKDTRLEDDLLQRIDNTGREAVATLNAGGALDQEWRSRLAFFVSFMRYRTPSFEAEFNDLNDKLLKVVLSSLFANEAAARATLRQAKTADEDLSEDDFSELADFAARKQYTIETDRSGSLAGMVGLARKTAEILRRFNWDIILSPPKKGFVTTDNPFVLVSPPVREPGLFSNCPGRAGKGVRKLFPLCRRMCLIMGDIGGGT